MATGQPRITRVFGAVNIGSFRVSAMIMGEAEGGEMIVLGSTPVSNMRISQDSAFFTSPTSQDLKAWLVVGVFLTFKTDNHRKEHVDLDPVKVADDWEEADLDHLAAQLE